MSEYEKLSKDWVFPHGKYQGKTILEVAKINYSYILWCIRTYEWFFDGYFNEKIYKDLEKYEVIFDKISGKER